MVVTRTNTRLLWFVLTVVIGEKQRRNILIHCMAGETSFTSFSPLVPALSWLPTPLSPTPSSFLRHIQGCRRG